MAGSGIGDIGNGYLTSDKTRRRLKFVWRKSVQDNNKSCFQYCALFYNSSEWVKREEMEIIQFQQHYLWIQFFCNPEIIAFVLMYHPNLIPSLYTPPTWLLINTTTLYHLTSQYLRPVPASYQMILPPSWGILLISQGLLQAETQFLTHLPRTLTSSSKYLQTSSACDIIAPLRSRSSKNNLNGPWFLSLPLMKLLHCW